MRAVVSLAVAVAVAALSLSRPQAAPGRAWGQSELGLVGAVEYGLAVITDLPCDLSHLGLSGPEQILRHQKAPPGLILQGGGSGEASEAFCKIRPRHARLRGKFGHSPAPQRVVVHCAYQLIS